MPAGNHGSYILNLELDICFDEYHYHDSLQACHREELVILLLRHFARFSLLLLYRVAIGSFALLAGSNVSERYLFVISVFLPSYSMTLLFLHC